MIEILCIAAEITAVLLILSIAMPTASAKQDHPKNVQDSSPVDSKILAECGESIMAIRSLLFLQASKWIHEAEQSEDDEETDSKAKASRLLRDHLNLIETLQSPSEIDSVTRLNDRREIECFLTATSKWQPLSGSPIWVCLLQIDQLEQFDDSHGPIASELAIRQSSNYFRERLSGYGPLVRFNHHSFGIAMIGWQQTDVIEFLESVRRELAQQAVTIGESEFSTTASASAAMWDTSMQNNELWERLEDGIAEAVAAGANRGRWYERDSDTWRPMGSENFGDSSQDIQRDSESNHESNTPALPNSGVAESVRESSETKSNSNPRTSESSSSEAASSDDISALFKAAKMNHRKPEPASKTPNSTEPATATPEATPDAPEESNAAASIDDIAALFKAAKAHHDSAGPSVNRESPSVELPDSLATPTPEEEIANEVLEGVKATNEDMAALFATFSNPRNPQTAVADLPDS